MTPFFSAEGSTILNVGEIWTNSIKPEKILQEIFQATGGTDEECARAIEAVLSVTNAHWTRPGWTIQSNLTFKFLS
jgi:hypothetical protein